MCHRLQEAWYLLYQTIPVKSHPRREEGKAHAVITGPAVQGETLPF